MLFLCRGTVLLAKLNQTKPSQAKRNASQEHSNQTKLNQTKLNQTKPNQGKIKPHASRTKPNQTKPNQISLNQTELNQTKPNLIFFYHCFAASVAALEPVAVHYVLLHQISPPSRYVWFVALSLLFNKLHINLTANVGWIKACFWEAGLRSQPMCLRTRFLLP